MVLKLFIVFLRVGSLTCREMGKTVPIHWEQEERHLNGRKYKSR